MTNTREERVARPFDFAAIYTEARERFLNDATNPVDISETIARVAYEHGKVEPSPDVWEAIETAPKELKRCLLFCPELVSMSKEHDGVVMGRFMYGTPYGDGMNGDWTFTHWAVLTPPKVTVEEDRA